MIIPNFTNITTQSDFYLILRADKGLTLATFKNATELLDWYEDCTVSEGEEGRKFSDRILAWCQPYRELYELAQAEEEDNDGEEDNDCDLYEVKSYDRSD